MDQLKKAWGWLQRHHFWVLTIVAVLVAMYCWWSGANTLYQGYVANKSKIEAEFNATNSVRSTPFHANTSVQEAQQQEIANQQKSVNELWKKLYERQTATVLKWPSNLSEEFRNYIKNLKFGDNIPSALRSHYNNYIRDHFPKLPKIVAALETPEGESGGFDGGFDVRAFLDRNRNRGGGNDRSENVIVDEPEFIVVWADQEQVRNQLYPSQTPSAKRIWKTQEDLWVYEALLTIIANTNNAANADRFSNAAIRIIESLEVGRSAAEASRGRGRIDMVSGLPAAGSEPMGEGGYDPSSDAARSSGEMSSEMDGMTGRSIEGEANDAELFNNRYVGADGAPIADPGDGSASFGAEFKRLPVRMRLWMDQRWLPHLIAECANAPLQVEVQEVRVNPLDNSGGMGGGDFSSRGFGTVGSQGIEEMTPAPEPNMKTVILQGAVYIFNPPSEAPPTDESLATAGVE